MRIALLLFFLTVCSTSYADIWVVYQGNDVISISEQNDAVVPDGASVKKIPGTIKDLALSRPQEFYKFNGNAFVPRADKIKAYEDEIVATENSKQARKAAKQSAKAKLTALGLTEDEATAITEEK